MLASIGFIFASTVTADAKPSQQSDKPSATAKPAADGKDAKAAADAKQAPAAPLQRFDIDDFAVQGADTLPQIDVEEAIYPFLGPSRERR